MRRALRAMLLSLGVAGCQMVGGFDEFESSSAVVGVVGAPCSDPSECGDLICLYGVCRTPCQSPTQCPKDSICLGQAEHGGCRLAGDAEHKCDTTCQNPSLACGLDKTCRTPCSAEKPCPLNGEVCIAGACVSTGESDWAGSWGQCTKPEGDLGCGADGKTLIGCNLSAPGRVTLATCATTASCQAAVTANQRTCSEPLCTPTTFTCDGAKLMGCDANGVPKLADTCASAPLCERGRPTGACAPPACGEGADPPLASKCTDGNAAVCSADQQMFEVTPCQDQQCNPAVGECFKLDIDATEVTRAQYAAFVASTSQPPDQPMGCAWNTSLVPDATCMNSTDVCHDPAGSCDAHPQVCVDWCDAAAYCAAHGRRLCGAIAGGMVPLDQYANPGKSQWMNACSSGGSNQWTHGNTWSAGAEGQICDGAAKAKGTNGKTFPVTELTSCHSAVASYAKLLDLSGNVAEWEDSCSAVASSSTASKDDTCRVRGGSYASNITALRCDANPALMARSAVSPEVGFRCCL
jgi:formylglycine-generating enzyme